MTKNYCDQRDALFELSDYLVDVLTQYIFIELKFYREGKSSNPEDLESLLVQLYIAILHYTALVQKAQSTSKIKKLLDCITAITEYLLTEFKTLIEKERDSLYKWIKLCEYLQREKNAEKILCEIDELAKSMKQLSKQSGFKNLSIVEGVFFDFFVNQHEDFCLLETRIDLLRQIWEWAESEGKFIFWLNGMAGTGKSTIV